MVSTEVVVMLREAKGRANLTEAGLRIYIPKDLIQSVSFPFRDEISKKKPFDVLIQIDDTSKSLVIKKYGIA